MKKLLSYIIVFVMLISFNLLDVSSISFDCECSGKVDGDSFEFKFHFDDHELHEVPMFIMKMNGLFPLKDGNDNFKFRIQNYNRLYGDNNNYTYINEYTNKIQYKEQNGNMYVNLCPTYVYVAKDGIKPLDIEKNGIHYHVFAADDESKYDIISNFDDDYDQDGGLIVDTYYATYGQGKCKMTGYNADPVVSNSNEPSNEPTDPNSNIPTVNSNKTLDDDNTIYFCGSKYADDAVMRNIPADVPRIIRFIYIFLQVLVPIGIVVVSSIDLFKAISAQKEDDIKKGQQTLIKRIVAAVIIFFVFAIVKLVLSVISDNSDSIIDCISCFLENSDEYCIKHVQ